jgi:hypothetical protein
LGLAAYPKIWGWSLDSAWGLHFGSNVCWKPLGKKMKEFGYIIMCFLFQIFPCVIWEFTVLRFNI